MPNAFVVESVSYSRMRSMARSAAAFVLGDVCRPEPVELPGDCADRLHSDEHASGAGQRDVVSDPRRLVDQDAEARFERAALAADGDAFIGDIGDRADDSARVAFWSAAGKDGADRVAADRFRAFQTAGGASGGSGGCDGAARL